MGITEQQLKNSPYWSDKSRIEGDYYRNLICQDCGKESAWCSASQPHMIYCDHKNSCGHQAVFTDVCKIDYEKQFPPTKEDPNRPATEYLMSERGFSEDTLKHISYRYEKNIRGTGRGGVLVKVGEGAYNGRIFDPPKGVDKGHNVGKTAGLIWQSTCQVYNPEQDIFVAESIFNALSFFQTGHQAFSILSASVDPKKVNLNGFKKICFAFDNDAAGQKALKKWKQRFPESSAIMPFPGTDWNDLLRQGRLTPENFDEFKFLGQLAAAKNPNEYAEVFYERKDKAPGLFEYDGEYFYGSLKKRQDNDELTVYRCSDFTVTANHFTLDDTVPDRPEHSVNLTVTPKHGRKTTFIASATELATAGKLREFFINRAWLHGKVIPRPALR